MKFASRKYPGDFIILKDLMPGRGVLRQVQIASAYFDLESVNDLFEIIKSRRPKQSKIKIRFFFDRAAARLHSDQATLKRLQEINAELREFGTDDSGLYLVQIGTLFHSKIYQSLSASSGKIWVGSMNLTQNGLKRNEETMFGGDFNVESRSALRKLSADINGYFDSIITEGRAIPITEFSSRSPVIGIRDFFMDGVIFFRHSIQSPFAFKLYLPEEILHQPSEIDPLLGASQNDSIMLTSLIRDSERKRIDEPTNKPKQPRWKQWCIETCYGFWTPTAYLETVRKAVKDGENHRRPKFEKLKEKISKGETRSEIEQNFMALHKSITTYLSKRDIPDPTWKFSNADDAKERWNSWVSRLASKLSDDSYFDRLVAEVAEAPCPDVWNDPLSAKEFELSFGEHILYLANSNSQNKIKDQFLNNLKQDSGSFYFESAEDVVSNVSKWLGKSEGKPFFPCAGSQQQFIRCEAEDLFDQINIRLQPLSEGHSLSESEESSLRESLNKYWTIECPNNAQHCIDGLCSFASRREWITQLGYENLSQLLESYDYPENEGDISPPQKQ